MGKSLKGKELGRGISQRKSDGLYMARYTDRFGKRKVLYSSSYTDICNKFREAEYENAHLLNVKDTELTLDEWYDIWIKTYKSHCVDTTLRTYNICYARIKDELGWRKLSDLSPVIIQASLNLLRSDNAREDTKSVLVDILKAAVEAELIIRNSAEKVKTDLNKEEKKERPILLSDEADVFFSFLKEKSPTTYPIYLIMYETGMRIGEVLGLCWDSVDLTNNKITIKRTLTWLPDLDGNIHFRFHEPKTTAGKRVIPMSKTVRDIFVTLKENGHDGNGEFSDLVFTTRSGAPVYDCNVRCAIRVVNRDILKLYPNFKSRDLTPHSFRHSFATRCIAAGMKPKVLQKILGHKSVQTTMDLYCHVEDDLKRSEMSLITEMA